MFCGTREFVSSVIRAILTYRPAGTIGRARSQPTEMGQVTAYGVCLLPLIQPQQFSSQWRQFCGLTYLMLLLVSELPRCYAGDLYDQAR